MLCFCAVIVLHLNLVFPKTSYCANFLRKGIQYPNAFF